jgi:hypothetical protein
MSTTVWFATPNPISDDQILKYDRVAFGPEATAEMLRHADEVRRGRSSHADQGNYAGHCVLVLVEDAPHLLADVKYGDEIRELAHTLTRHGREVNVRLEIQW